MNSTTVALRLNAAAMCGLLLAGCNAVEDVRSNPSTPLPVRVVVLEGKVYGLGIRRSIVIRNAAAVGVSTRAVQGFPGEQIGPRGRESLFSFGALPVGTNYDLVIPPELVPFGKSCVVNNGQGTLSYDAGDVFQGAPQNIEVVCTNLPETVVPK
jgi:hypothetical protein